MKCLFLIRNEIKKKARKKSISGDEKKLISCSAMKFISLQALPQAELFFFIT